MIVSMTGFGDASADRDGTHYAIEVRSLNNRYFKPVIKLPDNVAGLEPEIETMLREKLGRGSITCILKMRVENADAAYHINTDALESYLVQLKKVKGLDGIARIDLASLLQLPGVCQQVGDDTDEITKHGATIRQLAGVAIDKLMAMRHKEGESLFADLMKHTGTISESLKQIALRAPQVVADYHARLTKRVAELLSKAELRLNDGDLIREVAVFAERADISEEIQRLTHHLEAFEHACRASGKDGDHAGRKLDFMTQEMLREANTIASKANDATIARHTVEIKGAIDRLKEQVQNVE